ncbi:hypothetical protein N9166_00385 [bacterium]|nr:hypothetical protein [bacterium]
MSYLLAALALGAACVLWFLVQRWAGAEEESSCPEADPDCAACARGEPAASASVAAAPAHCRDPNAPER